MFHVRRPSSDPSNSKSAGGTCRQRRKESCMTLACRLADHEAKVADVKLQLERAGLLCSRWGLSEEAVGELAFFCMLLDWKAEAETRLLRACPMLGIPVVMPSIGYVCCMSAWTM
eukprot:1211967-Amphidinium_carterae.1